METLYFNHRIMWFACALGLPAALAVLHYGLYGANGVHLKDLPRTLPRFGTAERVIHLIRMLAFIIVALTGMAIVYVKTCGGVVGQDPQVMQANGMTHGISGIFFVLSTVAALVIWFRAGLWQAYDREWLRHKGGYLSREHVAVPAGKFNAGQKVFLWLTVFFPALLGVSGMILMANLHSPAAWYQTVVAVHGISATVIIALVIGHVYLSVVANPGTWRVLVDGRVAKEWAAYHHPNWR